MTKHIVPVGTQIVSHIDVKKRNGDIDVVAGSVGVVIKAPLDQTHSYRVRFMDNTETSLRRTNFAIRRHFQNPVEPSERLTVQNLHDRIIYRCVVGSRAYGLDGEGSDIDRRGIYLPDADTHWSLYGAPEQLENEQTQECYWELQKFITLALKANPNVLECLFTPLVEFASPLAEELLSQRDIFLSKLIYQTYNGYVMSQFRKMQKDIQNYGSIRWKHAMHLIRLLISGITALQEGHIPVRVADYRDELLTIRRGEMDWESLEKWQKQLHKEFELAFQSTKLPDRPDYDRANQFLIAARRSAVEK